MGSEGPTGPAGPTGPTGPAGQDGQDGQDGQAYAPLVEKCGGCHSDLVAKHTPRNDVAVSNVRLLPNAAGADLTLTFNIKVDGVNSNAFTHNAGLYWWHFVAANNGYTREQPAVTAMPVVQNWNGNYTVTLAGFGGTGATPALAGDTFVLRVDTGNSQPQATVVAHVGDTYATSNGVTTVTLVSQRSLVTDQACINCHGDRVFAGLDANGIPSGHHGVNPVGYEACKVCHQRFDSSESRLGTSGAAGTAPGTRLMGYVHGIHNSHNMPAGTVGTPPNTVQKPAGTYARNNSATSWFSIGFPGYMQNCATCHSPTKFVDDTAAVKVTQLDNVLDKPVSWATCMSCHDGWASFDAGIATIHQNYNATTTPATCAFCHDGTMAPATLRAAHNNALLMTERAGLVYDGQDQSVVEGKKIAMSIDSVALAGKTLTVTWSAKQNGTAIDPCNTNLDAGPAFVGITAAAATGKAASNMSILRAYAIGDDWVNPLQAGSPGQPNSTNLTVGTGGNTTCAANVATTVITLGATEPPAGITKGMISLQGKPQIRFAPLPATSTRAYIQVRSPSPTREFMIADGSLPAQTRRQTISTAKCEACHLGSLYQHGGNRIDSVALCAACHNPASNEENNRVGMGVDATESYDGRPGQTYDLREMVHAIHSAGETGRGLNYYRSNGIYWFGNQAPANWPASGGISCKNAEGATVTYYKVFGSTATGTVPQADANGNCVTTGLANSTDGTWRVFNQVTIHYPRPLNECSACHVDGAVDDVPNPKLAVGVTEYDAGAAPWNDLADDVLVGPTAAACMTCHQSGDELRQFQLRTHAYSNGIIPGAYGRQELIDAVP